jgi:hypothetical protein
MSTQYDPSRGPPPRANDDTRSLPQLLGDMLTELSGLVRKEIQLARAEMGEKASEAGGAIPGMAGGAALALGGLILLLMALAALVARVLDLDPGWGLLIVGLLAAIAGYALIRGGMATLKATTLTPHRTAKQLSRDAEAAKEQVR